MTEYFYSKMTVSFDLSESEANLGIDDQEREVIIKLSFNDIRCIHETKYKDGSKGVTIIYYNDSVYNLNDTFGRVDRLHSDYMREQGKELLIKAN